MVIDDIADMQSGEFQFFDDIKHDAGDVLFRLVSSLSVTELAVFSDLYVGMQPSDVAKKRDIHCSTVTRAQKRAKEKYIEIIRGDEMMGRKNRSSTVSQIQGMLSEIKEISGADLDAFVLMRSDMERLTKTLLCGQCGHYRAGGYCVRRQVAGIRETGGGCDYFMVTK